MHIVYAAENRKESRGSHAREDFKVFTIFGMYNLIYNLLIFTKNSNKNYIYRNESTSMIMRNRSKVKRSGRIKNIGANTHLHGLDQMVQWVIELVHILLSFILQIYIHMYICYIHSYTTEDHTMEFYLSKSVKTNSLYD